MNTKRQHVYVCPHCGVVGLQRCILILVAKDSKLNFIQVDMLVTTLKETSLMEHPCSDDAVTVALG